jgi:hypothetical protein
MNRRIPFAVAHPIMEIHAIADSYKHLRKNYHYTVIQALLAMLPHRNAM